MKPRRIPLVDDYTISQQQETTFNHRALINRFIDYYGVASCFCLSRNLLKFIRADLLSNFYET